ncbi:efflux transporter periplasmic adaptor subunit [Pokkaliibacter plantistimulans]|uniref:Efflux transporter periplasmic adaptor subunit n=1 Tax=Proteobacteria bacterium 228 TaxID=2083153 RepID=A0A2S5KMN8_9PROT|nr:efflux RND transporter periplasmic adaptor subunit [Pokkaliibacter plantistimulans]PPC75972.1 efflux transporter periplasmic adaptor subunit [Pokkaliibacter plantistimulans]
MKYLSTMAGLILVPLALVGCQKEEVAQQQHQQRTPEVGYITLTTSEVPLKTELQGRTVASTTAEVRPQVSGIVEKRLFEEGSEVKKGQLLYQIDDSSYKAAYNEARADLLNSEATVRSAKLKDQRYAALAKSEGVSRQDADDAHAAYLEAVASVEKYKAAVESAKIDLDHTQVKAPIAGRIGISSVTEGALVTADQDTALATIRSLNPIYVDLTQSSKEVLKLRQTLKRSGVSSGNTEVSLQLEDGSTYADKGTLTVREVAVDESTGSVTLRAQFPNDDDLLMPGMFVRAVLDEAVDTQAMLVPQRGVARDARGNATALVIKDDGTVEQRQVTTDRSIGDKWLITQGLSAGDKLIVEGTGKVAAGQKVKSVEVELAADGSVTDKAADASRVANQGATDQDKGAM